MSSSLEKIILGIDTSCDDTSVAVVQGRRVLSNVISSQDEVHRAFGGVVPMLAKRAHETQFPIVLKKALQRAKVTPENIDCIAVTRGPGLAPALELGLQKAKELAQEWNKPITGINHLEGHLWSAVAETSTGSGGWKFKSADFPILGVIVSGGHTELYEITGVGQYTHLGGTVDDAFGEAFDKAARLLGLGYPGGAALADLAESGDSAAYSLPRPMRLTPDYNVSYSGLKTALVRLVEEVSQKNQRLLTETEIRNLAASFQAAATDTILNKVQKALKEHTYKHILLGGGGAANKQLRKKLRIIAKNYSSELHVPNKNSLLRDNAAMIALAAALRLEKNIPLNAEMDRIPHWKLESPDENKL